MVAKRRAAKGEQVLDRIFFYGTMRSGQAARSLISDHVRESESALLSGRLYAFDDGYPGALLAGAGAAGSIHGEVVTLVDLPAAFALLDAYQGDDFVRAQVEVELEGGDKVASWCYLLATEALAGDGELVESGDWISYDRDL